MTTSRRRAFVSIAAAMTVTLALGGCVSAASHPMSDAQLLADAHQFTIRFDNLARERVHVYLIGPTREWLLGRVEPGAIASLRIPKEAVAEGSMFVRLAVLAGERQTFEAARHPRARLTIAQPASAILKQHWSFSQGELTSLGR